LNKILREEFVTLYKQPLLENLMRDFKQSFPDLHFPEIPERGNLDLREVLNSTYFFS
jgi:DNA-directed RNA polymerase